MTEDLVRLGAIGLAKAIREKKVSCREVMKAHLDRMDAVNGKINAVTVVLGDEALDAASEADEMVAEGKEIGPLHGVPMTVKENIDLVGSATSQGVTMMKNMEPPIDCPHVAQLKRAGAIPIGRTNMPDFGLRWHTDNDLRGATINPWKRILTPGGSSGGEAAAIATGVSPLGLGNDYGGSLRYPSQCCGITAIRPTLGRVPFASSLSPIEHPLTIQMFAVQGPMARHVKDLRLALNAMSGPDPRDPWWTPAPQQGPVLSAPIRVAVTANPANQGVDQEVAASVHKAARTLSEAGYEIEETEPPLVEEAANQWAELVIAEIRGILFPLIQPLISSGALEFLNLLFAAFPEIDLLSYMQRISERNTIAREWSQFQQRYPLVLGPVSTSPPFQVGYDIAGSEECAQVLGSFRLTTTVNLLGLPSAAVPVEMFNGVPQGVQIIGPRYREDLCLDAAEAIEAKLGVLTPIEPKV
jgi:amidase